MTRALQSVASGALDVVANANTPVGQAPVTIAATAGLALIAWRREPGAAWLGAGLFAIVAGAGLLMKLALVHPPPPAEYVRALWDPLGFGVPTPSAFPSGHIARVGFLAIFAVGLASGTWVRVALVALIVWTFWSRVYIGDHWISDAVGGLALGTAAGCAAVAWVIRCRGYDRSR